MSLVGAAQGALDFGQTLLASQAVLGLGLLATVLALCFFVRRWPLGRARTALAAPEDALRELDEARTRLRAFVEAAADAVYGVDLAGRITSMSTAGQRLFGYGEQEVPLLHLRDLFEPRFLPLVLPRPDGFSAQRLVERGEALARTRTGENLWLEVVTRLVCHGGEPAGFEATARDITACRSSEAQVAHHSQLAGRIAQETALDGTLPGVLEALGGELGWDYAEMWWVDEQYGVLRPMDSWFEAGAELVQFAEGVRKQTLGRGAGIAGRAWMLSETVHVSDLSSARDSDWAALARNHGFEAALAFPVKISGKVVGVIGLFGRERRRTGVPPLDLLETLGGQIGQFVERQRAEDALRISEARKHAVLESAMDCVITVDHQGRILEFNPAAERTFGYARADVLGETMTRLLIPEEARELHEKAFQHCLDTGERRLRDRRIEVEAMRKDGNRFPAELAVTPVHVGAQPVFTAYVRDISERRQVERLKDELVSTVSHELRTPLASLRGFVELLLVRKYSQEEQRKFLVIIDQEIKRLTRLINDFLDIQRLESAGQTYQFCEIDIGQLVRGALEIARGGDSSHEFDVEIAVDGTKIHGDADRLHQALMNLLSNAAKFSPDGGRITACAAAFEESVRISVRDQGIGMDPNTVEKLFSKFYRADNSATRSIEGTGLGLALVREIVTAHGGRVWVESEPGQGSEFFIELPIAEASEEKAQ